MYYSYVCSILHLIDKENDSRKVLSEKEEYKDTTSNMVLYHEY